MYTLFSIISCFEASSFQWSLTLHFLEVTLEVVQLSVKNQQFFQNQNSKLNIFFKNEVQTHEKWLYSHENVCRLYSVTQNVRSLTLHRIVFNVTFLFDSQQFVNIGWKIDADNKKRSKSNIYYLFTALNESSDFDKQ